MKKRVTLALCALLFSALCFTGCSGGETGISLGSTWVESQAKTYEYNLTHTPDKSICGYGFTLTEGKYTTTLATTTHEGEKRYIYTTVLTVSGAYIKGEERFPFTDVTTTETVMRGINSYSLFPEKSTRKIFQHSVYPKEDNSGFTIREHDYEVITDYNYAKKKADVSFYAKNPQTGNYDLPVTGIPETRTYGKLKANSFFDNDAMTFVFRAFPLEPGFTASFTTLDTVNAKKVKMFVSADKEITSRSYKINGEDTALDVIKLSARMDAGASSGKPFILYYAPMEGKTERNILTELTTTLPYGMGPLTYSLINL